MSHCELKPNRRYMGNVFKNKEGSVCTKGILIFESLIMGGSD